MGARRSIDELSLDKGAGGGVLYGGVMRMWVLLMSSPFNPLPRLPQAIFLLAAFALKRLLVATVGESTERVPTSMLAFATEARVLFWGG